MSKIPGRNKYRSLRHLLTRSKQQNQKQIGCCAEHLIFGFRNSIFELMRYLLSLLSVSVFEEFFSQQICNRSGLAVADNPSVDIDNPYDLGSGTGEEKLIADI